MYDYRRQLWKRLILWLLTFAAVITLSLGLGIAIGRYYLPNVEAWDVALEEARAANAELREQAESDYYRGAYDILIWISKASGMPIPAIPVVERAHQSNWYEQESSGWSWPLNE